MESKRLHEIARQKYYSKKAIQETDESDGTIKPFKGPVDESQSPTAITIFVPDGTGGHSQSALQFESAI